MGRPEEDNKPCRSQDIAVAGPVRAYDEGLPLLVSFLKTALLGQGAALPVW